MTLSFPVRDPEIADNDKEVWSDSYLVDNLKQHLATVKLSKSKTQTDLLDAPNDKFNSNICLISNRHYVNQVFHYLKVGILRPVPEYLVSLSDLSPKLVQELASLAGKDRKFVLKQAVGRILRYQFQSLPQFCFQGS